MSVYFAAWLSMLAAASHISYKNATMVSEVFFFLCPQKELSREAATTKRPVARTKQQRATKRQRNYHERQRNNNGRRPKSLGQGHKSASLRDFLFLLFFQGSYRFLVAKLKTFSGHFTKRYFLFPDSKLV